MIEPPAATREKSSVSLTANSSGILRTHETGPQQYAIGRRFAAGDAVAEPRARDCAARGAPATPPEDAALEQRAAVERG